MSQAGQHKRQRPANVQSSLLNEQENQELLSIIGNRCVTLASAVVQVILAEPPNRNQWSKKCCGVGCLVKDNHKRSYFIRVYDLKMKNCIWEQELYNQFKYSTPRNLFHTFEADNCPAGLNFANENEANEFKRAVDDKLLQRAKRKQERKKMSQKSPPRPNVAPPSNSGMAQTSPVAPSAPATPTFSANSGDTLKKREDKNKKKDKNKGKITKADIGTPSNFRHVGHVGWDPNKGFDMDQLDPSLKELFDRVGISESQLRDKETATFIYDFIEKHGGVEAVKQDQNFTLMPQAPAPPQSYSSPAPEPYHSPPAVPPSGPPRLPSRGPQAPAPAPPPQPPGRGQVPPPPARNDRFAAAPPPPPSNRGRPAAAPGPPPPPSRTAAMPAPPAPPSIAPPAPPPPPPPASSGPPPPPMIGGGPPPPPPPGPPPPPAPGLPPAQSGRSALMDSIKGTGNKSALKKVDQNETGSAAQSDGRGALMNQIHLGITLNKVDPSDRERPKSNNEEDEGSLANALKKALDFRAGHIQGDDSSDEEDEDDDDDEWD